MTGSDEILNGIERIMIIQPAMTNWFGLTLELNISFKGRCITRISKCSIQMVEPEWLLLVKYVETVTRSFDSTNWMAGVKTVWRGWTWLINLGYMRWTNYNQNTIHTCYTKTLCHDVFPSTTTKRNHQAYFYHPTSCSSSAGLITSLNSNWS